MTFERSIPFAEQYPSRIAVSSVVASHRISGTANPTKKARRMPKGRAGAKYGGRYNAWKHFRLLVCGLPVEKHGVGHLSQAQLDTDDLREPVQSRTIRQRLTERSQEHALCLSAFRRI